MSAPKSVIVFDCVLGTFPYYFSKYAMCVFVCLCVCVLTFLCFEAERTIALYARQPRACFTLPAVQITRIYIYIHLCIIYFYMYYSVFVLSFNKRIFTHWFYASFFVCVTVDHG